MNVMNEIRFTRINEALTAIKTQIVDHPAYKAIQTLDDLKIFMEHHIFAVWDFMSLLKALQNKLTCTQVPWVPVGNPQARYLINEIVCGEESDVAYGKAGHLSHFELYLEAMQQIGADTQAIENLLSNLKNGVSLNQAISDSSIPESARTFLHFTFNVIEQGEPHIIAAVFTFGREDLIPNMFRTLVADMYKQFPEQVDIFNYYLERHIEVDGDHHGHLALEIIAELCGEDEQKWAKVTEYAQKALEYRNELWNGVARSIETSVKL